MSTNEQTGLATLDSLTSIIQSEQQKSEAALSKVMGAGFMPYVSLYGANSEIVKEGKFQMGHFALVDGKNLIDLGEQVVMFFLARRPKAMTYKPEVASFYDTDSDEFKDIMTRCETQQNANAGFGVEFFVYIPKVQRFALYFLGNRTGRNECPNIINYMANGKPVALVQKSVLLKNTKGTWHGPSTQQIDQPVEIPEDKLAEFKNRYHAFCNPPVKEVAVEESGDESRD